jgi:hypothetical protein
VNSWHINSYVKATIFSFFDGPQNVKIRQKCLKDISAYHFTPFIKSTHPYPRYFGIQSISAAWQMALTLVWSPPPIVGLASKLWFCVVHPEAEVNTQPTLHCTYEICTLPCSTSGQAKHMTPYMISLLWPVLTTLNFQPSGGRCWCFPWGGFI